MGEEQKSGGTARYIDSAAERLQVKVTGWVDNATVMSPAYALRLVALLRLAPRHQRADAIGIRRA
ncbi:transglutaminase family protein [Acidocella sp.]|uniref:transglutaminase family protein n=1 Tax=Acidocella sp. TaxID=50710 RepID=UPI003458CBEA